MTLKSSRRGTCTLELHGQAITCIPYQSKLAELEKALRLDWEEILQAIMFGLPVPGSEKLDDEGKPIPGTARLKQQPRLIIPLCYYTQVGSNHSEDAIGEWILGDAEALSQEPCKSNLARFLIEVAGGDYDDMLAKAKTAIDEAAPEKKRRTSLYELRSMDQWYMLMRKRKLTPGQIAYMTYAEMKREVLCALEETLDRLEHQPASHVTSYDQNSIPADLPDSQRENRMLALSAAFNAPKGLNTGNT